MGRIVSQPDGDVADMTSSIGLTVPVVEMAAGIVSALGLKSRMAGRSFLEIQFGKDRKP